MILDKNQKKIYSRLESLHNHINDWSRGRHSKLRRLITNTKAIDGIPPHGMYIWGSVGSGKTMLVDSFLTKFGKRVYRSHYHEFMLDFHKKRAKYHGANVVNEIVRNMKKTTDILFIDEFIVADIADAMVLLQLLLLLAKERIFMITTGNSKVSNLYKDGFQRKNFLPAIQRLKSYYEVIELSSDIDYRSQQLDTALTQYNDMTSESQIHRWFEQVSSGRCGKRSITINDHELIVLGDSNGFILCEYEDICGGRRSSSDYLSLALTHHALILCEFPDYLDDERSDSMRRFINLVDIWYDKGKTVLPPISLNIDTWYRGSRLKNEFSRTISRLGQMRGYHSDRNGSC